MLPVRLHIIAFDIPYPPDYGGVIDIHFRIRALHALGIHIVLHCFQYRKPVAPELLSWCEEVHYYHRPVYRDLLHMRLPYIVASRQHPDLLRNLLLDDAPILFEGLHTTALLPHPGLKNRMKMVRMHNIEHHYYQQLAGQENNPLRRAFFHVEAARLNKYEPILDHAQGIAAISLDDEKVLKKKYGERVILLPAFHPHSYVKSLPGIGKYALYHGNLSVAENHKAANCLIREVFSALDYPLIIAGKNPKASLVKAAAGYSNIQIISSPDESLLTRHMQDAQVIVLPTFQDTGLKIKLLNSLFLGRHIVANPMMVSGTGLEELVNITDGPSAFQSAVMSCAQQVFTAEDVEKRTAVLFPKFDPLHNARILAARMGISSV